MSCIDKMTIQGIRSYGPKDQDTQVIEFFFPVTLIVGQNGCGKTTVIECLKFATTSDMPPNTKGSAFVFDPKLIDEVETKGRIKLYFRDTSGLSVQVQKNLCSTQKAKKLEFRTAETIISRYNKEQKLMSSITSKCINADAEVINAFGVSKAVLEHVIFCHQEDSNWPLSEGKVLKTRFDEIFAATKYIKALEQLRKIRLEKSQLIKQKDIEKKFLESNKNHADSLNRDLGDNNNKYALLKQKKEAVIEELKPVQKQIEKYFLQSSKIAEIKGQLDKIENEKLLLEKQIKELLVLTKHCLFQGTDDELKEHVKTYNETTEKMRSDEERAAEQKISSLNLELKELNNKKSKLIVEIGALENKHKIYNENRQKLVDLLKRASLTIETPFEFENFLEETVASNNADLDAFMHKLNTFIQSYIQETTLLDEKNKSEERKIQKEMETERDSKSKIDQNIETKSEMIEKNKKQLSQIQKDLKFISNDNVLNKLNGEIDDCDMELEGKLMGIIDIDSIKKELTLDESERKEFKEKENKLENKLNKLHENSKHQTEIDLLRSDKISKENQIKKIRMHIGEDLNSFFDTENNEDEDIIENISNNFNLKELFDERLKTTVSEYSVVETKHKEIEKRLLSNDMKRKIVYDELVSKEILLRKYEEQLMQIEDCISSQEDIEQFDSILEKLQEEHKSNMDEKGFLNGVDKTYKRFLTQLEESKSPKKTRTSKNTQSNKDDHSSCPVCMRDFKDQQELDDTVTELKKYSQKLPKKIVNIDEKILETENKMQSMIKMKPTKESYEKIKMHDLVDLRRQLENIDRNLTPGIKKELKVNLDKMKKIEKLKSFSESIQGDIVIINKYAYEVRDLERKIDQQIILLGPKTESDENSDFDHQISPLDKAKSKKLEIQKKIEELNIKIQTNQAAINQNYTDQDQVNTLKEKLNNFKTQKNELQSKMQKKTQLNEKVNDLEDENDKNKKEIQLLNKKLNSLKEKINNLSSLKSNHYETTKKLQNQRSEFLINDLQNLKRSFNELISSNRVFEDNESTKLKEVKKVLKNHDKEETQIQMNIDSLRKKLEDIKIELARQEIKHRELNDNLQLRDKRQEYEKKKKQYVKKKEEMDLDDLNINFKTFKSDQEKAERMQNELAHNLNEIRTKMNVMEGKIQTINEELDSDNYKNAFDKWSVCASDLRVLEISVIDIEKYYKALDRAVMNYHQAKMNEINKTVRTLWRQVYRGNDIDYVEIRSEEDGVEEVQLKSRRTYNYRVVIVRNGTALDMRGRCSAGQKVLASIIIRLALAEVFCLNSGILALDEPTTNLDRENIESLSSALVDIIKTRSKQKNFQLIIITHDEDFLEMLGRSDYMDSFYRVKKDDNGFSKISRKSNIDL